MKPPLALAGAALALAPLLSGCVAVAAIPVLAGGAMFAGGNVKIRAATPRPKGTVQVVDARPGRPEPAPVAGAPGQRGPAVLNTVAAPVPAPRATPDPWQPFVAWSLDRAARLGEPGRHSSMLFETGSQLAVPRLRDCKARTPAVVIDLDPQTAPWSAGTASPPPGLAADLARLREAGIAVLWLTALPASRVGEVAAALQHSGLDPAGTDPLLLLRNGTDRKQVLREDANRDVCVIAIAGDRKGDFDELFDYLRDPAAGQGFDSFLGAGWFLVPPPLQ